LWQGAFVVHKKINSRVAADCPLQVTQLAATVFGLKRKSSGLPVKNGIPGTKKNYTPLYNQRRSEHGMRLLDMNIRCG
jgi:hypothetical protein